MLFRTLAFTVMASLVACSSGDDTPLNTGDDGPSANVDTSALGIALVPESITVYGGSAEVLYTTTE